MYLVLLTLILSIGTAWATEEKKDTCPSDLLQWRSMAASYSNDYNRKVQELAQKDQQIAALAAKVKALEEAGKKPPEGK